MGRASTAASTEQNHTQALKLEVPIIVRLAERTMRVSEVLDLAPGSIIELPKSAESELDLLVNNRPVGVGVAVKVGENFGLRVTHVGDPATRGQPKPEAPDKAGAEDALAEALLAGQLG
jgi:flagellar motor switch protein FliN/FliY